MPLYEFECLNCGHRFTHILKVDQFEKQEKEGFTCPQCRSKNVEELISVEVHTAKKS